ncbi:MAG: RNA-binding cell elongation regulator Jag/EloR [Selenomonadaceae bacterium]
MAEVVEKTGKTVEEALVAAMEELDVTEDRISYEVLEEPTKGFLGIIGVKPARIKVTVRDLLPLEKAEVFLREIFRQMKLTLTVEHSEQEDGHVFNLIGSDLGILIGKHGQTLDALQYLTNLAANKGLAEDKVRIIIDVENYRSRREETLRRLALRLADRVRHSGEKIILEPMNRHERKVIHTALQDNRRVVTYSDGEEPYRKVVIDLKHHKSVN